MMEETEPQERPAQEARTEEDQEAPETESDEEVVKKPMRNKRGRPPRKATGQAPAQAARDKNYLGPRTRKVPLKYDTMHMYRVTIEAIRAQTGRAPRLSTLPPPSTCAVSRRPYAETRSSRRHELGSSCGTSGAHARTHARLHARTRDCDGCCRLMHEMILGCC